MLNRYRASSETHWCCFAQLNINGFGAQDHISL